MFSFFVGEQPLLYKMFTEAAAGTDGVLWLLGHDSQWLPRTDSRLAGKSASFHCPVLGVSRILLTEVKTKIKMSVSTVTLCLQDSISPFLNSKPVLW